MQTQWIPIGAAVAILFLGIFIFSVGRALWFFKKKITFKTQQTFYLILIWQYSLIWPQNQIWVPWGVTLTSHLEKSSSLITKQDGITQYSSRSSVYFWSIIKMSPSLSPFFYVHDILEFCILKVMGTVITRRDGYLAVMEPPPPLLWSPKNIFQENVQNFKIGAVVFELWFF